jgi:glucose-1-phosphate thymidylyltransferase
MKGIVLAGGSGTRLYPITEGVSKQLIPIYDKPMIYYPISVLMLAGIKDILIITTPHDQAAFKKLLGDGSQYGINLSYEIQPEPKGIAQAFIIGKDFIGNDSVALILGDNIFYGAQFSKTLKDSVKEVEEKSHALIFGYEVKDPERYGVAGFDEDGKLWCLVEKPEKDPPSNVAVVGLYMYPNSVVEYAESKIKPSKRGELEITDLNKWYLYINNLYIHKLPRGMAWLDTGTIKSLNEANNFIEAIQERQGLKVACLEEIGFKNKWLSQENLYKSIEKYKNNEYGEYLYRLSLSTWYNTYINSQKRQASEEVDKMYKNLNKINE